MVNDTILVIEDTDEGYKDRAVDERDEAKAANDTADEIEAGQHKTIADAQRARDDKYAALHRAHEKTAAPATHPTTAPNREHPSKAGR